MQIKKFCQHIWLVILMAFAALAVIFVVLLSVTGKSCLWYNGFAIDSSNRLYLGRNQEIVVFDQNSKELYRWEVPTSRGYRFTIYDECIYLFAHQQCYILDFYGNIQDVRSSGETPKIQDWPNHSFITNDGSTYHLYNTFLRTTIVKENNNGKNVIFRMPWKDYILRIVLIGAGCCIAFSLVTIVVRRYMR